MQKIAIRHTLVYATIFGLVVITYVSTIFLVVNLIRNNLNNWLSWQYFLANIVGALFIGFSFEPLRQFFQRKTENFLFRKDYDIAQVIQEISSKLNNADSLEEALNLTMEQIVKTLKLSFAISYVFHANEDESMVVKNILPYKFTEKDNTILELKDFLAQYWRNTTAITILANLKKETEAEKLLLEHPNRELREMSKDNLTDYIRQHSIKQSIIKKMEQLKAENAIPIHLNGQLVILILISNKLSDDSLYPNDLILLNDIRSLITTNIQKAKLYESDKMKTEFISIATHELLTPISAMNGYLSMILDENIGHIDRKSREYLQNTYSASRRLALLVKDILTVSRLESGTIAFAPKPFQIEAVIQSVVDQEVIGAAAKGLVLAFEKPGHNLPAVFADPARVEEILSNLINNAVKYTPQGSVMVRVSLTSQTKDAKDGAKPTALAYVTVEVEDTGIGVSPQDRAHLFQKFFRGDNDTAKGSVGTGLGLYIVKMEIEKMGGSIICKSKPDKGSNFILELPVASNEEINKHEALVNTAT